MFTTRKQGPEEASSPGLYGFFRSGLSKVMPASTSAKLYSTTPTLLTLHLPYHRSQVEVAEHPHLLSHLKVGWR